jgi:ABC-type Fe3+/spermidine/putrescine transport system ATPase subunit
MTAVQINDLHYSYGAQTALRGITYDAPDGRITALLGPSGCGKTTLLKLIAGLLTPSRGDIAFDGRSVVHIAAEKRNAAMVFQNHRLFPFMSVAENVGFGLRMRGTPPGAISLTVSEMLACVKLTGYENRRPGQLSGGQQQRVALARALVVKPAVLLLDEPLSNLDAHLRDEMRVLIRELQRQTGVTTLFVTHDQAEAVQLADHVAVMFDGELQQCGEPRVFYERPATQRIARFFGGVNFFPGAWRGGAVETDVGSLHVIDAVRSSTSGTREPTEPMCTLTIRPEHVQLADTACAERGVNVIVGRLVERCYAGTHTQFTVKAGNSTIQFTAPVDAMTQLAMGDAVRLYLPPEKVWVMPITLSRGGS